MALPLAVGARELGVAVEFEVIVALDVALGTLRAGLRARVEDGVVARAVLRSAAGYTQGS